MNNSSTITIAPTAVVVTELWERLLQATLYIVLLGIITSTASLAICVGIYKSKKLRTRFFVIIWFLTMCRALLGLQYLAVGIFRMLKHLDYIQNIMIRFECHTLHFWIMCGSTLEMFLLLTLVLDRALAIVAPNYYRLLKPIQAAYLCLVITILVCGIALGLSYSNVDLLEKIACGSSYSPTSKQFNDFTQIIDFVVVVLILLAYVILIICIKWKVNKTGPTIDQNSAVHVHLHRQLKLMPMLRRLVLSHCGLSLLARLLFLLAVPFPEYVSRLGVHGGSIVALDEFLNVVFLLHMNKDLRVASLPSYFARLGPNPITTMPPVSKILIHVDTGTIKNMIQSQIAVD